MCWQNTARTSLEQPSTERALVPSFVVSTTRERFERVAPAIVRSGLAMPQWIPGIPENGTEGAGDTCTKLSRQQQADVNVLVANQQAWQRIRDGQHVGAFVFEDDVEFVSTPELLLQDVDRCNSNSNCSILFGGYVDAYFATHALYVKRSGARRLLSTLRNTWGRCRGKVVPLDHVTKQLCARKASWYQERHAPWYLLRGLEPFCMGPSPVPTDRTRLRPSGLAGLGHFVQNRAGVAPVRTPELAGSVWYT